MVKKLTAVRIREKTLEELSKIAKREDEKLSEVIRRALEDFVKREAKRKLR
jgi:predicted transcriptional regulator